jgi:hypothetical protein
MRRQIYLDYRALWEGEGGVFIHHRSAADSIKALKARGYI